MRAKTSKSAEVMAAVNRSIVSRTLYLLATVISPLFSMGSLLIRKCKETLFSVGAYHNFAWRRKLPSSQEQEGMLQYVSQGPIAQRLEQPAHNWLVAGSIPAGPIYIHRLNMSVFCALSNISSFKIVSRRSMLRNWYG